MPLFQALTALQGYPLRTGAAEFGTRNSRMNPFFARPMGEAWLQSAYRVSADAGLPARRDADSAVPAEKTHDAQRRPPVYLVLGPVSRR